jgi:hypothetical protein
MDNQFQQLYELVFNPVVTPHSLVDNAKLQNYEYVSYSRSGLGLKVSLRCILDDGVKADFEYYFDQADNLQLALMMSDEGPEILFDRKAEILRVQEQIISERNKVYSKSAG